MRTAQLGRVGSNKSACHLQDLGKQKTMMMNPRIGAGRRSNKYCTARMSDRPDERRITATYRNREEAPLADQLACLPLCFDLNLRISPVEKDEFTSGCSGWRRGSGVRTDVRAMSRILSTKGMSAEWSRLRPTLAAKTNS